MLSRGRPVKKLFSEVGKGIRATKVTEASSFFSKLFIFQVFSNEIICFMIFAKIGESKVDKIIR